MSFTAETEPKHTCKGCDRLFTKKHYRQVFCDPACCTNHFNKQKREAMDLLRKQKGGTECASTATPC